MRFLAWQYISSCWEALCWSRLTKLAGVQLLFCRLSAPICFSLSLVRSPVASMAQSAVETCGTAYPIVTSPHQVCEPSTGQTRHKSQMQVCSNRTASVASVRKSTSGRSKIWQEWPQISMTSFQPNELRRPL